MNFFHDITNPFTANDDKFADKLMLIPSIGSEMNDKRGKFSCRIQGWYYQSLNSSNILIFLKIEYLNFKF